MRPGWPPLAPGIWEMLVLLEHTAAVGYTWCLLVPSPLTAGAGEGPGVPVSGRAGERAQQAAELPGGAGCHEAASG